MKKAKDKPSVENTVAHIATWVIAGLRHHRFATLAELRVAAYERVQAYNAEPFQKRQGSRLSVFDAEERPLLSPLPAVPFEISRWTYGRRVARNGHVVWEKNYYSVPFAHIGRSVDLRVTDTMIEVFAGNQGLTSHLLAAPGMTNAYRTHDADLPDGARYREWDPSRVREWAGRIGESTLTVVDRIFESVPVAEQGINPALAVLRLTRRYSAARLEAACQIALGSGVRSPRYAHLRPILETGQDQSGRGRPLVEPESGPAGAAPSGYVRGADYYAGGPR